jgi:predicted dinucleotide-binding enzyme
VSAGHSVTLVGKDPEDAQELAVELRGAAQKGAQVSTATLADVQPGEVVILAVWHGVNSQVVKQLGSKLNGKVIVDIANPLNSTSNGLATAPGSSSAEEVAQAAPARAKVVKAFNTTFAGTLLQGEVGGRRLDVLIAGDDPQAKKRLAEVVEEAGLRPIDAGPLERARQLEGIGSLHITLQQELGSSWMSAVKFLN